MSKKTERHLDKGLTQDTEQAFSQWLDKKTSDSNETIENDQTFSVGSGQQWEDRKNTANYLAHHAEIAELEDVPQWDRSAAFTTDKKPWWQWSALPAISLAFSCFAVALVLLKVELVVKPEGVMLSFADGVRTSQNADLERLIDQKLQTFANEQQVILANYAADIKVKQQESNLQLASYVIGASRKERKEDMNDFIQYINNQRADEQFDQNLKFKQLEQAIRYKTTTYEPNKTNSSLQTTSEEWTTEE